jgi:hypothetical protein
MNPQRDPRIFTDLLRQTRAPTIENNTQSQGMAGEGD